MVTTASSLPGGPPVCRPQPGAAEASGSAQCGGRGPAVLLGHIAVCRGATPVGTRPVSAQVGLEHVDSASPTQSLRWATPQRLVPGGRLPAGGPGGADSWGAPPLCSALWGVPGGPPCSRQEGVVLCPGRRGRSTLSSLQGGPGLTYGGLTVPGPAPRCSGAEACGPPGLPCAVSPGEQGVAWLWSRRWPGAPPSRGASVVRSDTSVGKPRPAWTVMNRHEG